MSNEVINIRFGVWHFQVVRWGDWSLRKFMRYSDWPIRLSRNDYHKDNPIRFQVHEFYGYSDQRTKGR